MGIGVFFTNIQHFLESFQGWCNQECIITLAPDTTIFAVDPATNSTLLKNFCQFCVIKTIQNSTQNCPLANPVADSEDISELRIPSDVGPLIEINEKEDPDEDNGERSEKKLAE